MDESCEISQLEKRKNIVLGALTAMSAGDYRGYIDCLSEDVVFHIVGAERRNGDTIGRETVWNQLLKPASRSIGESGYREEVLRILANGEWVAVESRGHETTKNGAAYNNEYCVFYKVMRGEIAEVRTYFNSEMAMRVKGV